MKSFKKIRRDALLFSQGKYWDGSGLFSGAIFDICKNKVVESYEVSAGVVQGEYVPRFFKGVNSSLKIDISDEVMADVYGAGIYGIKYDGKPFTGLAFEFDPETGECLEEFSLEAGSVIGYSMSDENGYSILELDLGGRSESYRWCDEGKPYSTDLYVKGFRLCLDYDADGKALYFGLSNSAGLNFREILDSVLFPPPFAGKASFSELECGREFVLRGDDVQDWLLG